MVSNTVSEATIGSLPLTVQHWGDLRTRCYVGHQVFFIRASDLSVFYPGVFFTLHPFLLYSIKASLGASSSSLKAVGLHAVAQLFESHSNSQTLCSERSAFVSVKYDYKLLMVKDLADKKQPFTKQPTNQQSSKTLQSVTIN